MAQPLSGNFDANQDQGAESVFEIRLREPDFPPGHFDYANGGPEEDVFGR